MDKNNVAFFFFFKQPSNIFFCALTPNTQLNKQTDIKKQTKEVQTHPNSIPHRTTNRPTSSHAHCLALALAGLCIRFQSHKFTLYIYIETSPGPVMCPPTRQRRLPPGPQPTRPTDEES